LLGGVTGPLGLEGPVGVVKFCFFANQSFANPKILPDFRPVFSTDFSAKSWVPIN
jgi:hypothetical protein